VALTGFARGVERQRFLRGGQAVVVKPILDHEELVAVIDSLVNPPAPVPRAPHALAPEQCPTDSTAAATHLDGRAAMAASGAGGSVETHGQGPA
jgi:hypothetical protein